MFHDWGVVVVPERSIAVDRHSGVLQWSLRGIAVVALGYEWGIQMN